MVLFLLSLALPAYHAYEDTPGLAAFLLGPIGLFGGHFSWLANPALATAWIMCRKKRYVAALTASVVATLLAATFLLQDSIPVGSSGDFPYQALSGYYVWLASIGYTIVAAALGVFFAENESEVAGTYSGGLSAKQGVIGAFLFALPAALAIGPLFFESHKIDVALSHLCATAGEKIIDMPTDVEGLYLEQIGSFSFGNIHDGKYGWRSSGLMGEVLVNSGLLSFYEYPDEKSKSYRRYDVVAKDQAVDSLLSAYVVTRSKATSTKEEQLGIKGFETTVKRLANGEQVASLRFFYHAKTSRICGFQKKAQVSETDFLTRALRLRRRFPYFKGGVLSKP